MAEFLDDISGAGKRLRTPYKDTVNVFAIHGKYHARIKVIKNHSD